MATSLFALALTQTVLASALPPEFADHPEPYDQAAVLPDGGLDPEERAALVEELDADLEELARLSSQVVLGEVLTSRPEFVDGVRLEVLTFLVDEALRGELRVGDVIELRVPLRGAMSGDTRDSYRSVRGYDLMLFVDDAGYLVDEDALFVMEGGFGFRAREPGRLMRPRMDHDWVRNIDPLEDYDVVSVPQVERALAETQQGDRDTRRRRRDRRR